MANHFVAGAIVGFVVALVLVGLLRNKMPKNLFNILLLFFAVFIFMIGAWQLDLICAPLVWGQENYMREVLPWIYLPNQTFYVLCYAAMFLGIPLTIITVWTWD